MRNRFIGIHTHSINTDLPRIVPSNDLTNDANRRADGSDGLEFYKWFWRLCPFVFVLLRLCRCGRCWLVYAFDHSRAIVDCTPNKQANNRDIDDQDVLE